jgi:NAD+ synthase (glutamine-hydrolysing)
MILEKYGYVRVAAAVPRVKVADPAANAREIVALMKSGAAEGVRVMVFPELSVTGYTCADLFHQRGLLDAAQGALCTILDETAGLDLLAAVGLPVEADNQLFNCRSL